MKALAQAQDKTYDAIYVNSYTQRVLGNDTQYVVKLYKAFTFSEISLTSAILENRFLNLYNGAQDYRDLSIDIQGVGIIAIKADQYYSSINVLTQWLNTQPQLAGYLFTITDRDSYSSTLQVKLSQAGIDKAFKCVGQGWTKLGCTVVGNDVYSGTKLFNNFYDLSQPSAYLVHIKELKAQISNGLGNASFILPNNASFNGKVLYQNQQKNTCQTIYLNKPITLEQLTIEIQTCDQTQAETVRAHNATTNMLGSEHIFCFNVR